MSPSSPGGDRSSADAATAARQVDAITAGLREQDRRLRRRTLWLTLLPVVVGVGVLVTAWWGVREAQRRNDALQLQQQALAQRIGDQQAAIDELAVQRAALDREIASRRDLLGHFAARLPAADRAEVERLERGLEQARSGDTAAAVEVYDEAIRRDEGNALSHRLRGEALWAAGDAEAARASLARAVEIDPADAQARYTLGLALWALGRRDEATAELQRAHQDADVLARALQDPAYQPIRGVLDTQAGQASARSNNEKAAIDRGLQAARRGDFGAAVAAYDEALAIRPDNARVLGWKGYALYRSQAYEAALASLDAAVRIAPANAELHYNRALALWRLGRLDAAGAALQAAYDTDPAYRAIVARDPQSRALRAALASGR